MNFEANLKTGRKFRGERIVEHCIYWKFRLFRVPPNVHLLKYKINLQCSSITTFYSTSTFITLHRPPTVPIFLSFPKWWSNSKDYRIFSFFYCYFLFHTCSGSAQLHSARSSHLLGVCFVVEFGGIKQYKDSLAQLTVYSITRDFSSSRLVNNGALWCVTPETLWSFN